MCISSSKLSNVLSVKLCGPGKESPWKEQLPRTWQLNNYQNSHRAGGSSRAEQPKWRGLIRRPEKAMSQERGRTRSRGRATFHQLFIPNTSPQNQSVRTKRENRKHTTVFGDFNTPLSEIARTSRQEISKDTEFLNNIISQHDFVNICKHYSQPLQNVFFPNGILR